MLFWRVSNNEKIIAFPETVLEFLRLNRYSNTLKKILHGLKSGDRRKFLLGTCGINKCRNDNRYSVKYLS